MRLTWNGNNHAYQRFDRVETRGNASQHCESLGAHLATITTQNEQRFIQTNILNGITSQFSYFIGGSGAGSRSEWKWVTGEPWTYTNWAVNYGEPSNRESEDNLIIFAFPNHASSYQWFDALVNDAYQGHICEWSFDRYVASTLVPDLNGNGKNEIAALRVNHLNGKHTVEIKDPGNAAILRTLTFATGYKGPQGIVALADLNGNRTPEIGVLYNANGPIVQIKDTSNNNTAIKTIRFLSNGWTPISAQAIADSNGNGSSEISVLATRLDEARVQIRDSKSGEILDRVDF